MEDPNPNRAHDIRPHDPAGGDPASGRDELNLAEFPLTAISHRVPAGCKALLFEDRIRDQGTGELVTRKLRITASEEYGLPTPADDDVIVGLIQLTKLANNFTSRTVEFTRYALIELLGWPDSGQSYARVEESLKRWLGVTLYYENAWWDKEEQAWVDEHFHIIDNVTLYDQEARLRRRRRGIVDVPLSSFSWNRVVFRSFQAENLKRLDLKLYFELTHAPAKRAYRFLDKRFYRRGRLAFDLREFACEHVGLSRNYDIGKIKEKLEPSIRELEERGFIEPLSREERYVRLRRGSWQVIFIKKAEEGPKPPRKARLRALERELVARGVTPTTATELVAKYLPQRVSVKLEVFDWLRENRDPRVSKNPAGYLVRSVQEDYTPPRGFEGRAEAAGRSEARREREGPRDKPARVPETRTAKSEDPDTHPIAVYLSSLTEAERRALEEEALAQADPWIAAQYERCLAEGTPGFAKHYLQAILDRHVGRILDGLPRA